MERQKAVLSRQERSSKEGGMRGIKGRVGNKEGERVKDE